MAPGQVATTAEIVMAPAGEGIHVVKGPYDALAFGQGFKEGRVVEKIHHPMQVHDVTVRDLGNHVHSVLGAIVPERFELAVAGSDGSIQFPLDLLPSDASCYSSVQRLGRIECDHGPVFGAGFPDEHRGMDARLPQPAVKAIGGTAGTPFTVIGDEMNDQHAGFSFERDLFDRISETIRRRQCSYVGHAKSPFLG